MSSLYKIKYITGCVCVMALFLTGCKKLIEIDPPLDQISSDVVFATDKTAKAALTGLYTTLSQSQVQGINLTLYGALQSDELLYQGTVVAQQELSNNTYTALSTSLTDVFSNWYATIYQTNSIILGLQRTAGTTAAVKKQLTAEAKLIRAYCYFNLVNAYGDVPLVLQTDVNVTAYQPKETTANIYRQIISDLTEAKADLLADYSYTSGDRMGVNKFTATALLARVYLFTADYAAAESNASEVIASSLYKMIPSATIGTGVFVKNSTESIWQMPPYLNNLNQYTLEGGTFVPTTYTATTTFNYKIQPGLIQEFGTTDLRRAAWIKEGTAGTTSYIIPFKYKYPTNPLAIAAGVNEMQTVLRLPEQYLIRAEARTRIGTNLTGALEDLNVTRLRAGLAASTTTVAATLLDEIALEGRKEFFCEQGYRWFNLKRTGKADAVLGALKATWRPAAKLLPFSQTILDANPNLIQNTGY